MRGQLKGEVSILNEIVKGEDMAVYVRDDVEELGTPPEENELSPIGEPRD
jgi:hypothetical protein